MASLCQSSPAVDRIELHVLESVVHPTHVPLHSEPEPSDPRRPGHHRPRRGLLGDRFRGGLRPIDLLVEAAKEGDRFEILAAAEPVRVPLPLFPGVVQVQHGSYRVHAQTIGVVALQPEERGGEQEAPDLVPAVIEDEAPPVRLIRLVRIGVLVHVAPVEEDEAVLVGREMRRHPVEDHTDPLLVQVVDQEHQVLRRPVAAGGSEEAGRLVSPRSVERVLHDGEELDVSEAEPARIGSELRRDFAVRTSPTRVRCAECVAPSTPSRPSRKRGPRRSIRSSEASRGRKRKDRSCPRGSPGVATGRGTCTRRRARRPE